MDLKKEVCEPRGSEKQRMKWKAQAGAGDKGLKRGKTKNVVGRYKNKEEHFKKTETYTGR